MRGNGVVEDVDEDWPPKDERVVGDDGFNLPLPEGSSPGGITPREGKVLLPSIVTRQWLFVQKVLFLFFF